MESLQSGALTISWLIDDLLDRNGIDYIPDHCFSHLSSIEMSVGFLLYSFIFYLIFFYYKYWSDLNSLKTTCQWNFIIVEILNDNKKQLLNKMID